MLYSYLKYEFSPLNKNPNEIDLNIASNKNINVDIVSIANINFFILIFCSHGESNAIIIKLITIFINIKYLNHLFPCTILEHNNLNLFSGENNIKLLLSILIISFISSTFFVNASPKLIPTPIIPFLFDVLFELGNSSFIQQSKNLFIQSYTFVQKPFISSSN